MAMRRYAKLAKTSRREIYVLGSYWPTLKREAIRVVPKSVPKRRI
jgi:hypothetical protein